MTCPLERRLGEVNAKAAADTLEDVRISSGEMKIPPLKAITSEAAEDAAERARQSGQFGDFWPAGPYAGE